MLLTFKPEFPDGKVCPQLRIRKSFGVTDGRQPTIRLDAS